MTSTETNQSKSKKSIRFVVFNGIIAALYVVLTYLLAPISYGPVQTVLFTMLTVAAGEAAVMAVLGLPLIAVIKNTGLKNKLP